MIKIYNINKNSIAKRCGLKAGDVIYKINNKEINDILDYLFYSKDESLLIEFFRQGELKKIGIVNKSLKDLGIEFEYTNVKRCTNKCIFCFIDQLPKGLRKTLYIKDDDTVLSILNGNYITLTNLTEKDFERIIEFRLSPLKISVHTTNPELREFILKNPRAKLILSQLEFLTEHKIEFDVQIVLMKGINDGKELDRTLMDLARFYPFVRSIAVVPVGLTKFREGLIHLDQFCKDDANSILEQLSNWQKRFYREFKTKLVFAADEFYIKANKEIPSCRFYEDFRQIENGVGMLALFKKQFMSSLKRLRENHTIKKHVTLVTGAAAYEFISELIFIFNQKFPGIKVDIIKITNNFLGESITVSGLLTGKDIIEQLEPCHIGDYILVPSNALNEEGRFLDDIHLNDIEKAFKVPVYAVENHGKKLLYYLLKGGEKI